ncbi:MAG: hypothetical protein EZS28_021481, partial [Streblomastix strix]
MVRTKTVQQASRERIRVFRNDGSDGYNFFWQLSKDSKNHEIFSKDYSLYNSVLAYLTIGDAEFLNHDRFSGQLDSDKWEAPICDNELLSKHMTHSSEYIYLRDNAIIRNENESLQLRSK